jgi:hypothetical protein
VQLFEAAAGLAGVGWSFEDEFSVASFEQLEDGADRAVRLGLGPRHLRDVLDDEGHSGRLRDNRRDNRQRIEGATIRAVVSRTLAMGNFVRNQTQRERL